MTPASLRTNYIEELKKCGDVLYKKNQYWEFIDTKTSPIKIGNVSNKFFNALLALPKNSDVSCFLSLEEKRYVTFILFVMTRSIITGIDI